MPNFAPKPVSSASGSQVPGQRLTVGAAPVSFSAFNSITNLVIIEIQGNNVWVTFDGSTPSASNGHLLYAGQIYHWSIETARIAEFIQVSASATVQLTEFVSGAGTDTILSDTAVIKRAPLTVSPSPSNLVTSVFGRTGAVTAQTGDYTPAQVGAEPDLGLPASLGMFLTSDLSGNRSWVLGSLIFTIPFLSYDDMSSYDVGPLATWWGGVSWGGTGGLQTVEPLNIDNMASYSVGPLTSPNGYSVSSNGQPWGGPWTVTTF